MAAQASGRKRKTATKTAAGKSAPTRTSSVRRRPSRGKTAAIGLARGLGRGTKRLGRLLLSIEIPERLRAEMIAVAAFSLAALLLLPLLGIVDDTTVIGVIGSGLAGLLGRGAVLLPFGIVWFAVEMLMDGDSGARRRRILGYALFAFSVAAFLHLIGAESPERGGGLIGDALGDAARLVGGSAGAGIILFTTGTIGVYLATGVDATEIIRSWRRIRAGQRARREQAMLANAPVVIREQTESTANFDTPTSTEETAFRPVINMPMRGREREKASTKAARGAKTKDTTEDISTQAELQANLPLPVTLPDIMKLTLYDSGAPDESELEQKAQLIQETLANFKVDASVREISPGPAVTLFALQPGPGVKVRRITELQNDLALALAARSIRIEAPVPGMARVGLELPNASIHTVGLRETIESIEFQSSKAKLPLAFGRDVNGNYVVADLARMPHLLIAGSTGSGKSVCINGIIATFLLTRQPEDLQMVLIDPKMVELVGFNGVPHLKCPVVTEMDKVVGTLRLVLKEMEDRYQRFSLLGVRNIDGYNLRREDDVSLEKLPYLVVIIDELADLMMTTPEEVETLLVRLTQMARATGIHLMIATQRPSVDVLTGLIKANVPARIAFAVTSQTDSRVILDLPGAERLLGKGDMLFLPPDAAKPQRVQGSFIDDRDLQFVVRHWRRVVPDHSYDQEWAEVPGSGAEGGEDGEDPLMEQALRIVRQQGTASASMLQRRLRIGYNRASRLIEQMEDEGVVGPADGSRSRPVYLNDEE